MSRRTRIRIIFAKDHCFPIISHSISSMASPSVVVNDVDTDTVCPVCWESVHSDKPVGVATGCGHIWHQACFRLWKSQGDYQYELSTTTDSSGRQLQPSNNSNNEQRCRYQLNSNLNCLICNQPTLNFVDLFIRLPCAMPYSTNQKDLVTKLEHQFHTVSRRTQLSLEQEISRREFEQTWLQEERQLSLAAQQRARQRHGKAIQELESNLVVLKRKYQRKMRRVEALRHGDHQSDSGIRGGGTIHHSLRLELLSLQGGSELSLDSDIENSSGSVSSDSDSSNGSTSDSSNTGREQVQGQAPLFTGYLSGDFLLEERTSAVAAASRELDLMDESTRPVLMLATAGTRIDTDNQSLSLLQDEGSALTDQISPRARRANRMIQKDTIFCPDETSKASLVPATASTKPRSSRSLLKDEIFLPKSMPLVVLNAIEEDGDQKLPAAENNATSERRLSSSYAESGALSAEYERQRLQAETAYYQHQAELVEWEFHQSEIELEQDELDLRQRERRISQERSLLEDSFTSIQRRVEEEKQEARDRQILTSLEEKFVTFKIVRRKEEERFVQELGHLQDDEVHIQERESSEKRRQESEKIRLKKELNRLVKVMNKLECAKESFKLAEEQSSASQSLETCVVCFEPLVNEDSELGVAVPCGHTFHSACFASWEKSKRRRESSNVPCPLCNVGTSLCVTIRFNRPGCSLYCSTTSSLAKHFQKEECRWQRRSQRLLQNVAGEASS